MFQLFISEEGGLTTLGYVAVAIIIFLLLILVSTIGNNKKKMSAKQLVFCAVSIALAFVASNFKLFRMPMGGSITFFSMFFIVFTGYLYGPAVGLTVGVAYGLLQMLIDPYVISLPQLLVDYVFAFGALGISGFFRNQKYGLVIGYLASVFGRFVFAVLSGVIFFGMYAPEGTSPLIYSITYNGGYLGVEAAMTMAILLIPAVRNGLNQVRKMAVE